MSPNRQLIPASVIAVVAKQLSGTGSRAHLTYMLQAAGCPGEDPAPEGSKLTMVTQWLRVTNQQHPEPLVVLGRVLEEFMDAEIELGSLWLPEDRRRRGRQSATCLPATTLLTSAAARSLGQAYSGRRAH